MAAGKVIVLGEYPSEKELKSSFFQYSLTPDDKILRVPSSGVEVLNRSIGRLTEAKRSDVLEVAASQIEMLSIYHNVVLDQSRRSFLWALIAASIGLAFYLAAVTSIIILGHQEIAVISIISGSLIEVISGINFYLYGKTTSQMSEFQTRLERIQRYLLANSICEGLKGDHKQESRKELVRVIAEGASTREEVVTKTE